MAELTDTHPEIYDGLRRRHTRKQIVETGHWTNMCRVCGETFPCATAQLLGERDGLQAEVAALREERDAARDADAELLDILEEQLAVTPDQLAAASADPDLYERAEARLRAAANDTMSERDRLRDERNAERGSNATLRTLFAATLVERDAANAIAAALRAEREAWWQERSRLRAALHAYRQTHTERPRYLLGGVCVCDLCEEARRALDDTPP